METNQDTKKNIKRTFQNLPEKIKKILIQVQHNKIIKIVEEGIFLNEKIVKNEFLQSQSKNLITELFSPEETDFILFFFDILLKTKYNFLGYLGVSNHYYKFFPSERKEKEIISTGEEKPKKNEKKSGSSGDSSHPSSSLRSKRVKDEEFEIVESTPLNELDKKVLEHINELGVIINPDPIFHAIRIKYLFGANEREYELNKSQDQLDQEYDLYQKIVKNLKPWFKPNEKGKIDWNYQGWAWPQLWIDPINKIPAHFTIQMHENGRFIIPLRRDINIKEFIHDMSLVFCQFLSREELEAFFKYLLLVNENGHYYKREDGNYVHLAHSIGPEDVVDQKLNKACVKIQFIDYGRNPRVKVYIDKSKGQEIEGEFKTPEGRDLFNAVTRGAIVSGNLSNINQRLKVVDDDLNYIMGATNEVFNVSSNNGQSLQIIQQETKNQYQDTISYLSEIDARLNNNDLRQNIRHEDIKNILKYLKKQFPQIKENFSRYYSKQSKENKKIRKNLINLIISILNLDTDHKNDLEEQTSYIESVINETFFDTSIEIHNAKDETVKELHGAKKEIVQTINDRFDSMNDMINKEFEEVKFRIKNALYLILRKLQNGPGMTAKSLSRELNVSQKTIYSYLKKLQDKNLIETRIKKLSSGRGRPAKLFKFNIKKFYK